MRRHDDRGRMRPSLLRPFAAAPLILVALWGCRGEDGLRVMLAATPESAQTEAYRSLLAEHFPVVEVMPLDDLATAELDEFDVLVVDGTSERLEDGRNPIPAPPPGLSLGTFSIPTVLIGGTGGRISDSLDLKLGWRYG